MLAVAERAPTTFGGLVGRLPGRVVQEYAQSSEVVEVQMLLLPAEWCQGRTVRIILPDAIPLLGVGRSTPLTVIILPTGEPRLQKGTRYA